MGDVISSDDIDMPEMPDPEQIPDTPIDTSTAFSGNVAPIKKDPEEMVQLRGEGKLPVQESETSMIADNVTLKPDEPIPDTPPPGE
ncbi:MAG TPA: hypothetical protein VFV09_10260 [Actinomycetota bacterium]|jgi:hypothetical protein|nr:hypothetical protein [Actinomycetota bacterium]